MAHSLNFTVDTLLAQQVELIGPSAVSLDSLWRAAGCPMERSPRRWMELAAPLIQGFRAYLENLPADSGADLADGQRLLWVWEGEDSEPWQSGDVMTHELLARIYAAYLDSAP
jgi:hypothetical protein